MGLRRHHDEPHIRFQMREKLIAVGDDYWIEDDQGSKVYKVNGKAARVRDTWKLEDAGRNTVAEIQEKKLSVRDKIKIDLPGGRSATVMARINTVSLSSKTSTPYVSLTRNHFLEISAILSPSRSISYS